jgi:hypothetical protein
MRLHRRHPEQLIPAVNPFPPQWIFDADNNLGSVVEDVGRR